MQGIEKQLTVMQWHHLARNGAKIPLRTTLVGFSMHPLIRRNKDVVTIEYPSRRLVCGDIVLFIDNRGKYVVHRIYRFDQELVQTFGDNCDHPDAWVPYGNILGLVVSVTRGRKTYNLDSDVSRKWGIFWMKLFSVRRPFRLGRKVLRHVMQCVLRKLH